MKKLLFTVATMVLSVSAFFGTTGFYASAETAESEEVVPLYIENEEVTVTDNAITFSAELMMDSARANVPDVAGYFDTTIYIDDDNRHGEIWWTVQLGTLDVIKSVTGTVIIKRDWFGPINPLLDTRAVNYVNYGTQYSTARDIVEYDLGDNYKDSDNFIFKFENFQVQGVQQHYTIVYKEVQKEIRELERF